MRNAAKPTHWALKGRFCGALVIAESEANKEKAAILRQVMEGTTTKRYFLVVKKEGGNRTTKYVSGLISECVANAGKIHKDTLDLGIIGYTLSTSLSKPYARKVLSEAVGFVALALLEKCMKKG